MDEHNHQKLFIAWCRKHYPAVPVFAIPNGGSRGVAEAKRLQDEGVLAGIPDLLFADGNPGLFIEMKEPLKGRLQKVQKDMIEILKTNGYPVAVCFGYEAAKQALINYIGDKSE